MNYSPEERIVKALFSFISNLAFIPIVRLMYLKNRHYHFIIGFFTICFTIFYHLCDDLDISLIFNVQRWHKLDNIASITSLSSLIIYLMNIQDNNINLMLNYVSFFIVLIFQIEDPFKNENIFAPLIIILIIYLISLVFLGFPKINKDICIYKTILYLVIGGGAFILSIDENKDYLRIIHSIWHLFICLQGFYTWQIKEDRFINMKELLFKPKEYFLIIENVETEITNKDKVINFEFNV